MDTHITHSYTLNFSILDSVDRMIRLEYYLQYTPEPANYAEAIANVRSLISTTNVPFGAPVSRLIVLAYTSLTKQYSLLLYHAFVLTVWRWNLPNLVDKLCR